MISEQQQEQAALCALGLLGPEEEAQFTEAVRSNPELREFVRALQQTADKLVLTAPVQAPPPGLKQKVLNRIQAASETAKAVQAVSEATAGLRFVANPAASGWKPLPIAGAWIKLLSFEPQRGYAVLLGKLEAGVRYPAHTNVGPEDFYILSGDLQVSGRSLGPGDFHHAEAGSQHEENYSVDGCTLLAVLTTDDPLVTLAMS